MTTATIVTLGIFIIGAVFAAGQLTARVKALEHWREEVRGRFEHVDQRFDRVERLIRGEEV